jgi:hypothetical protein
MVYFTDLGTDAQIIGIATNGMRQHIGAVLLQFACTFQGGEQKGQASKHHLFIPATRI